MSISEEPLYHTGCGGLFEDVPEEKFTIYVYTNTWDRCTKCGYKTTGDQYDDYTTLSTGEPIEWGAQ